MLKWLIVGGVAVWFLSNRTVDARRLNQKTCVGWQVKGWKTVFATKAAARVKVLTENAGHPALSSAQIDSFITCVRYA